MAYEVTATRRRPQRFEDMIGQDFVVATLQKSIAAGKIAHAYLFSGPRGCGKTSSARILAKALNCETGPGATPCGVCPACLEITRGSSLDVIEIDGASNTSVNDVRQIKDEVQFPPNSCRYKVYIIDEVHMLSTSAFNALLKTIEEPPPYVIFIFATTELHKVPATIKSRCQQFNFRLVSVEQLKTVLSEAAVEMGIQADDEALFWVAREATGSVRDAYTLFDQIAAFSDGHITFEKIRTKLGLVGVDRINRVAEACSDKNNLNALSALDEILQNGVSIEQCTVDMADYFRNLLLIRSGITKEALLGQSSERFSALVLKQWSTVQIERALGLMLQLFRDIRYSLDPRYELELAVSRLCWIADYVSPAEMKTAISQAQGLLQRNPPARGPSGPFDQADRSPAQTQPEPVRSPIAQPVNTAEKPSSETNEGPDSEERIENPFAAFKERLSGKRMDAAPAALPAEPVPAEPVPARPPAPPAPKLEEGSIAAATPVTTAESVPVKAGLPLEQLQEALVSFFQNSKNMVATSLAQAFDWDISGSIVSFSVEKPFIHNLLEQEHKIITEAVSRLLGHTYGIEIKIDASRGNTIEPEAEAHGIPPHVEMIRQMFKGTILGEG